MLMIVNKKKILILIQWSVEIYKKLFTISIELTNDANQSN